MNRQNSKIGGIPVTDHSKNGKQSNHASFGILDARCSKAIVERVFLEVIRAQIDTTPQKSFRAELTS